VAPIALRQIEASDWVRVHEWASTEAACRYQVWGPNDPEATKAFVAEAVTAWQGDARRVWAATASGLGVVGIGEVTVRNRVHRTAEIAYAVHVDLWGRAFGTAIAQALVEEARDGGMHRVFATCDPRNEGSRHVLTNIGMSHEGTLRHTLKIRDGWRDSEMYALTHGDESAAT
jgi:RimJ/RimL family protein N-acetyltransferase